MTTIGAYEAKTHLARLLDEVAAGKTFTITKHGVPVARLVPASDVHRHDTMAVIENLKAFRKGNRLDGLKIRDLIDEGRR